MFAVVAALALAQVAAPPVANCVPARWNSADPKSLDLVAETPVNCLLTEPAAWSPAFVSEARQRGIAVLGVLRPGGDPAGAAQAKPSALVLEGEFDASSVEKARATGLPVIQLPPRSALTPDPAGPVAGTNQGVWPGVRADIKAAATGGPWVDTNSGFLRLLRAATSAPVWIANTPPPKTVYPVTRYLQAIADAAVVGARWVIALDDDFNRRLLAREPNALRDWRRIGAQLRFFEDHKEWRDWQPYARLAVVQEPDNGAMLSGGILDMIVTKHTPVRPVARPRLEAASLKGATMAVAVDPSALTAEQKDALKGFTRAGGTLLNGPPGWKLPAARPGQVVMDQKEQAQIDDIWKGINSMIGRTNLGARLFNVSGMLSSVIADAGEKRIAVQLVNYTDYPVESVTVHLLGKFRSARLLAPEAPPRALEPYAVDESTTGVDIPQVGVIAALVLE